MSIALIFIILTFILLILYFVLKPRNVDLLAAGVVSLAVAVVLQLFKF